MACQASIQPGREKGGEIQTEATKYSFLGVALIKKGWNVF